MNDTKPSKKAFYAAFMGTVFAMLCCLTPVLVVVFAALGLAAFAPYLDYVLFPAMVILAVVSFLAYRAYKRDCARCAIDTGDDN